MLGFLYPNVEAIQKQAASVIMNYEQLLYT